MALITTYTNERTGLQVPSAYTIITSVEWNKMACRISLTSYVSKEKRDEDVTGNGIGGYSIFVEGLDTIEAMYNYLKTLPEFAGAVDA